MNYWQFKFKKEKEIFAEFATLQDGDIFETTIRENKILEEAGIDTIIFWDRTDKQKGIMLVTKLISNPYESDIYENGKAVAVKVLKKFDKPFRLDENGFKYLHDKLNTTKLKGRVQPRAKIDIKTGKRLLNKILPNFEEPDLRLLEIDESSLKDTLKLFLENYETYQKDGKKGCYYNVFMEANIAKQEIRHSAYLANLFDMEGKHFHKNLFFKNFIEELKLYENLSECEVLNNFDLENYSVKTEEFDDSKDKKGFMDIVIRDNDYLIIIENKTGTKDHTNQLMRYKNYAQELKDNEEIKDYIVLYLTPNGESPTDEKASEDDKIFNISYTYDIYNAMDNSIEDIKNETLKDIIIQYRNSVKLYAYELRIDWKYELDTIELITKDIDIFNSCEMITKLVNYNVISEYNFSEEEIKIAKWIGKLFIKSKARIERRFFVELHNKILDKLIEKKYNVFDSLMVYSNSKMDKMKDINTIYQNHKNKENSMVMYYKPVVDGIYKIFIENNINELEMFGCVNLDEIDESYTFSHTLFYPDEIMKLLEEEYLLNRIGEVEEILNKLIK